MIWGTNVNIAKVMERFKRFLLTFTLHDLQGQPGLTTGVPLDPNRPPYLQRMEDMAVSGETTLDIDCQHLRQVQSELYTQLITFPKEVIFSIICIELMLNYSTMQVLLPSMVSALYIGMIFRSPLYSLLICVCLE